jgi:hypothetical protein
MRFFRRRSSPALVTLLAVAMQLAVTLAQAHVHAQGHMPSGAGVWSGASLACRAIVRAPGCNPIVPHDHRRDCAMCWSLATTSGLLPASPLPEFAAPRFEVPRPLLRAAAVATSETVHFHARAPPHA